MTVDEQSKEYWKWRDTILRNEDVLLEALCFDLSYEPPYKIFFDFLNCLDEQHNKDVRNSGWHFLNDSGVTMLCLLYPSQLISAAALYYSARRHGYAFPDHRGRPWWDILEVSSRNIEKACDYIASFYQDNPARQSENPYTRTLERDVDAIAKTRVRGPSISASSTPIRHVDVSELAQSDDTDSTHRATLVVPSSGPTNGKRGRGSEGVTENGESDEAPVNGNAKPPNGTGSRAPTPVTELRVGQEVKRPRLEDETDSHALNDVPQPSEAKPVNGVREPSVDELSEGEVES